MNHSFFQILLMPPRENSLTDLYHHPPDRELHIPPEAAFFLKYVPQHKEGDYDRVKLVCRDYIPADSHMFKFHNISNRTMCEICSELKTTERRSSFWCLYCYLWTYFTPFSSVSIVNFEEVNAGWDHLKFFWRPTSTNFYILKYCV